MLAWDIVFLGVYRIFAVIIDVLIILNNAPLLVGIKFELVYFLGSQGIRYMLLVSLAAVGAGLLKSKEMRVLRSPQEFERRRKALEAIYVSGFGKAKDHQIEEEDETLMLFSTRLGWATGNN